MHVYLVGICGYETYEVRYVTLSEEKANELFEELRSELVNHNQEMIEYDKKEGLDWNIASWEKDIANLIKMKPGDAIHGDCPFIEIKQVEKDYISDKISETYNRFKRLDKVILDKDAIYCAIKNANHMRCITADLWTVIKELHADQNGD